MRVAPEPIWMPPPARGYAEPRCPRAQRLIEAPLWLWIGFASLLNGALWYLNR